MNVLSEQKKIEILYVMRYISNIYVSFIYMTKIVNNFFSSFVFILLQALTVHSNSSKSVNAWPSPSKNARAELAR